MLPCHCNSKVIHDEKLKIMNNVGHRKKVIIAIFNLLPILLLVCVAQVMSQIQEPPKPYPLVTDYPQEVQKVIDQIRAKDANAEYQVFGIMEMNAPDGRDVLENLFKTYNKSDYKSMHVLKDVKVSSASAFKHYVVLVKGSPRSVAVVSGNDGKDRVYEIPEGMPQYANGNIQDFIRKNLTYPEEARLKGISGTTYVELTVNEDGSLSDFAVKEGFYPACDAEAIRIAKSLPPWIPGKRNGKPIKVRVTLPVKFVL